MRGTILPFYHLSLLAGGAFKWQALPRKFEIKQRYLDSRGARSINHSRRLFAGDRRLFGDPGSRDPFGLLRNRSMVADLSLDPG